MPANPTTTSPTATDADFFIPPSDNCMCPACKGSGAGQGDSDHCGFCGGDGSVPLDAAQRFLATATDAGMRETAWTPWSRQRPTDTKALYRWRVPARMVCGAMLAPEWSDRLVFCGMGYAAHEWWPAGSRWDGYNRTVAKGLEWRLAEEGETEVKWVGLDLLPCPFTGKPPRVQACIKWVGALPYDAESLILHSALGTSYGWTAPRLLAVWNSRALSAATKQEADTARQSRAEGDGGRHG